MYANFDQCTCTSIQSVSLTSLGFLSATAEAWVTRVVHALVYNKYKKQVTNAEVSRQKRYKMSGRDNNRQFSSNRISMEKACIGMHLVCYYPYHSCLCPF